MQVRVQKGEEWKFVDFTVCHHARRVPVPPIDAHRQFSTAVANPLPQAIYRAHQHLETGNTALEIDIAQRAKSLSQHAQFAQVAEHRDEERRGEGVKVGGRRMPPSNFTHGRENSRVFLPLEGTEGGICGFARLRICPSAHLQIIHHAERAHRGHGEEQREREIVRKPGDDAGELDEGRDDELSIVVVIELAAREPGIIRREFRAANHRIEVCQVHRSLAAHRGVPQIGIAPANQHEREEE